MSLAEPGDGAATGLVDWRLFVPDTAPGEVAASPRNPVVTRT
ncbi:MAG TPA: hypothetical protein VGH76_09905 [Actinomycetospora sp.]|jgi:hypothetical protein